MSTKNVSTQQQQNQFDPTAMSAYQGLQGGAASTLQDFMQSPQSSGYFSQLLRQASESIGGRTQTAIDNLSNPALGANVSNPSAFFADQLRRTALGGQRMQSDALTNLLTQFAQMRLQAAGQAGGYRPLQTGGSGTQTMTQSGLGSWLPQLAGAAIGAGTMAATGGFGGGGFAKLFGGGAGTSSASLANGALANTPANMGQMFRDLPGGWGLGR